MVSIPRAMFLSYIRVRIATMVSTMAIPIGTLFTQIYPDGFPKL